MTQRHQRSAGRRAVLAFCLAALPALAGCGAGDPTYYTLQTWPGPATEAGPSPIEVRAPSVASLLDRDYIVQATKNYQMELAGNDAWAEPIGDMIARVLTADLAQRFPRATVFRAGSAIGSAPAAVVELAVDRFDEDASGQVVVHATLAVHAPDEPAATSLPIALSQPAGGTGTAALVATLSRMLGMIADRAAEQLVHLPPPGAPAPLG